MRVVRTSIELTVLLTGFLLGGTVGIGTVLYALAIGPITHVTIPGAADRPPASAREPGCDSRRAGAGEHARGGGADRLTGAPRISAGLQALVEPIARTAAKYGPAITWGAQRGSSTNPGATTPRANCKRAELGGNGLRAGAEVVLTAVERADAADQRERADDAGGGQEPEPTAGRRDSSRR